MIESGLEDDGIAGESVVDCRQRVESIARRRVDDIVVTKTPGHVESISHLFKLCVGGRQRQQLLVGQAAVGHAWQETATPGSLADRIEHPHIGIAKAFRDRRAVNIKSVQPVAQPAQNYPLSVVLAGVERMQ